MKPRHRGERRRIAQHRAANLDDAQHARLLTERGEAPRLEAGRRLQRPDAASTRAELAGNVSA